MVLRRMDNPKMEQPESETVPRPRDHPLPEEVLEKMVPNRSYVVADLVVEFEEQYDPARGTVRNRLEYLHEEGDVERIKHENGSVTYRKKKSFTDGVDETIEEQKGVLDRLDDG